MKKQVFIFEFPKANATIKVEVSPLCVKEMAIQYLKNQDVVFGSICLIEDVEENILAIACYSEGGRGGIKFFTEDDSVNDIKEMEEREQ